MKPCTNTLFATGTPADSSIAGQMMQWKRLMSLPITCTAVGPSPPGGSHHHWRKRSSG